MRRRNQLVLALLLLTGCAETGVPRIGVAMSAAPTVAAHIAAADRAPGLAPVEPLLQQQADADAAASLALAEEFVADARVMAVIGHSNSAASLAASQIYNRAGLVQIAPTTTAPVYSAAGPFSFRLVPTDTLQGAFMAAVVRRLWPEARRLAVVHVNDDYGRGLYREVRPRLESVVLEELYADAADAADFDGLRARLVAAAPDVVLWLGRPLALGRLLQPLRAALPGVGVLCGDACDQPRTYANPDGTFTGLRFVRFTDPSSADAAMVSFQRAYGERTGEVATSEALLTYDAVNLVRAALNDGVRTREQLRRYLASLGTERPPFRGLAGDISFNGSREVVRPYLLAEVGERGVTGLGQGQ